MLQCGICNRTNENEDCDDSLLYGEWMVKQKVTVHYYCLLLSTNLPQRGGDSSGILGFLLRDIRREADAAQKRKCVFCQKKGASVFCFKCRIVFHLGCGSENRCVFQFCDEFRSFCENCAPMDDYKRELEENPPKSVHCDICFRPIKPFLLHNITYGDCCRKGFTHRTCMRRYALSSGYYLRCLWCRSKKFHDTIRLQSVFVPDRDATWERQPNAYHELHSQRMRCEQEKCLCPNGRDYNKCSWIIQLCILCAATGSHYKCRVGAMRLPRSSSDWPNDFKCDMCIEVEQKLSSTNHNKSGTRPQKKSSWETADEHIDFSFYMPKTFCEPSIAQDDDSPVLSDDDASVITVVPSQRISVRSCSKINEMVDTLAPLVADITPYRDPVENSIIEVPDTQPVAQDSLLSGLTPPLQLRESFTVGDHFYLVVYEYNEKLTERCTGSCTLRFALNDPRLGDRSAETLVDLQVVQADIWFRDSNRGVFDQIDQYTKKA